MQTTKLSQQKGAATLAVVMILFFIIALVAAYTSRNLIFEQRTSANQYRSTQAFEAADAGLEWALAMLNGGRIDNACQPTTDSAFGTFRARYIDTVDSDGRIALKTRTATSGTPPVPLPLLPTCVFDAASGTWSCACPSDAVTVRPTVAATAARPMFRVRFEYPIGYIPADGAFALRIVSVGCTRPDDSCMLPDGSSTAPAGDAIAVLTSMVALKGSLSTLPGAAVAARGGVTGGGSLVTVNSNTATAGTTVMAGSAINGVVATGLPGTPANLSLSPDDPSLSVFGSGASYFAAFMGMNANVYESRPGIVRLNCTLVACTASQVVNAAALNPGQPVWVNGDLTVDGNIGAAPSATNLIGSEVPSLAPVLIVVTGQATLNTGTVYGVIYSRAASWNLGSGSATVRGALIAEGSLVGAGTQSIIHDADVLTWLRTRAGTVVRVPGGWKDFADAP